LIPTNPTEVDEFIYRAGIAAILIAFGVFFGAIFSIEFDGEDK